MWKADNSIIAAFEGMASAARQQQNDAVLMLHALKAASAIAEGIPGQEARELEQLIDASISVATRTLEHSAISRNELHEATLNIEVLLQNQQVRINDRDITHDHRQ